MMPSSAWHVHKQSIMIELADEIHINSTKQTVCAHNIAGPFLPSTFSSPSARSGVKMKDSKHKSRCHDMDNLYIYMLMKQNMLLDWFAFETQTAAAYNQSCNKPQNSMQVHQQGGQQSLITAFQNKNMQEGHSRGIHLHRHVHHDHHLPYLNPAKGVEWFMIHASKVKQPSVTTSQAPLFSPKTTSFKQLPNHHKRNDIGYVNLLSQHKHVHTLAKQNSARTIIILDNHAYL